MTRAMPRVECIIPILRVANLQASLKFYRDTLGFKLDWGGGGTDKMCSVSRDDQHIMLCEAAQGNPGTWLWIGVEDIEPLHEQAKRDNLNMVMPPTNFSWAYEFRIADPEGHILRIGSDPLQNTPLEDHKA